jgi:hypothetical protein
MRSSATVFIVSGKEFMEATMNFRTLAIAAVLGLGLTGTGYAACDQTAGAEFHWSWPKQDGSAKNSDGTAVAATRNAEGEQVQGPTRQADAGKSMNGACN